MYFYSPQPPSPKPTPTTSPRSPSKNCFYTMSPNSLHPQVIVHGTLAQNLANRDHSYRNRVAFPQYQQNHPHHSNHHPAHNTQFHPPHGVTHQPSPAMRDRTRSGGQTQRDMVWVDSKERLSEMATDIRGISSALSNVALAVPVSRIMILSKLSDYDIEDKLREVTSFLLNWKCEAKRDEAPLPKHGHAPIIDNRNSHHRSHPHHTHHHTALEVHEHHEVEEVQQQVITDQAVPVPMPTEPAKWYTGTDGDEVKAAQNPEEIFSSSPPVSNSISTNSSANSSFITLEVARTNDAKKTLTSTIGHGKASDEKPKQQQQQQQQQHHQHQPHHNHREPVSESCTTGNLVVYVQDIFVKRGVVKGPEFDQWMSEGRLKVWKNTNVAEQAEQIDLIITLGGDGTVLYNSWLFQRMVPPTLSFALGSLGFMTENVYDDYKSVLDHSLTHGIICTLRMRFQCEVMRTKNPEKEGSDDLREEIFMGGQNSHFTTHTADGKYTILNEAVVDRGPNPFVTMTELYGDYELLTSIKADGVVISTPTGSTAYSMSAGGSLVHPDIPARLISPICPHTLSFRPLVVPDSMALHIGVPYDARSSAFVSFDGKGRVELRRGDFMTINVSRYPFPKVLPPGSTSVSWVQQLSRTLHWNEQKRPKRYTDGTTDNWIGEK